MRIKRKDLPEGEYDILKPYLSDTDEGSDVETILANNPELAERFNKSDPLPALTDTGVENTVMFTGVPKKKLPKLHEALTKEVKKTMEEAQLLPPNVTFEVHIPQFTNAEEVILGYKIAFVTFSEKIDLKLACEALKQIVLGNDITFNVFPLEEYAARLSGNYKHPPLSVKYVDRENLLDWMLDPLGREQFAYRQGLDTKLMWFDALAKQPESAYDDEERLGYSVCWSPRGSFLLTFHKRGVWIRGNSQFEKLMQFKHVGVQHVLFSPNEEYLITFNEKFESNTSPANPIIIWNCFTGRKLSSLAPPSHSPTGVSVATKVCWPLYQFSSDSKYIAARGQTGLIIYQTATASPLEDPDKVDASISESAWFSYPLEQFKWSPTDNFISVWIPEIGDSPGRLLILDVDKRIEVASTNVFSVKNVSMHWSPCGEFLALVTVIVRRLHKKLKKDVTQIEVFRVKEKSVPVDIIDLEGFTVKHLAWERGHGARRFATLTIEEATSKKSVTFFEVPARNSKLDSKLVASLPVNQNVNHLTWSPGGQYLVVASKSADGHILFCLLTDQNKAEIIQGDDQMDLSHISWDPSGRFVTAASLVTPDTPGFRMSATAGFSIYTSLGRLLYRLKGENMSQFFWRPRPPPMISRTKLDEITKKLKEYSKRFDTQDESRRQAQNLALKEQGIEQFTKFAEWQAIADKFLSEHALAQEWAECWNRLNDRLDWREETVVVERVISVEREKLAV